MKNSFWLLRRRVELLAMTKHCSQMCFLIEYVKLLGGGFNRKLRGNWFSNSNLCKKKVFSLKWKIPPIVNTFEWWVTLAVFHSSEIPRFVLLLSKTLQDLPFFFSFRASSKIWQMKRLACLISSSILFKFLKCEGEEFLHCNPDVLWSTTGRF